MKVFICLLLLSLNAHADLGDTYAVSCKRFGGSGQVNHSAMQWMLANGLLITEVFHNNQCVSISYVPPKGRLLVEGGIWKLLVLNSKAGAVWQAYGNDPAKLQYVTSDGGLYGVFQIDGEFCVLRIAYASYLASHGLLTKPEEVRAPVEDGDGI